MRLFLQLDLKLLEVRIFLVILEDQQVQTFLHILQLRLKVIVAHQQLSVVLSDRYQLLVFDLTLFFLLLLLLFLFAFVAFDPPVVSDLELFKLEDFLLIELTYGLCDVMKQAEHFAEVASVHHRSEAINLLVRVEQIKQVLDLLHRVLRAEAALFVLLRHALDHLAGISAACRLLKLLHHGLLVLTLRC